MDKHLNNRSILLLFSGIITCYSFWTLYLLWIEPMVGDCLVSILGSQRSLFEIFKRYKWAYFNENSRIGYLLLITYGAKYRRLFFSGLSIISLPFLIIYFIKGRKIVLSSIEDLTFFSMILSLFWLTIPKIGEMFFYSPCNTQYVFPLSCLLLYLIPYRRSISERLSPKICIPIFVLLPVLGFIVGLGNEHTIPPILIIIFLYLIWILYRKEFQAWMGTGFVGLLVGYLVLFFAPGHNQRFLTMARTGHLDAVDAKSSLIVKLYSRLISDWPTIPSIFYDFTVKSNFLSIACVILIPLSLLFVKKTDDNKNLLLISTMMLTSCLLCLGILFISPVLADRLFFGPSIFLICAFMASFLTIINSETKATKILLMFFLIISLVYNSFQFYQGFKSFRNYSQEVDFRMNDILSDNMSGAFRYIEESKLKDDKWHLDDGLTTMCQRTALCNKYRFDWISVGSRFLYQLKPEEFNLDVQITQLSLANEKYIQKIKAGNVDLLSSTAGINVLSLTNKAYIYLKESFYKEEDSLMAKCRLTNLLKNLQDNSITIIVISKNAQYNEDVNKMLYNSNAIGDISNNNLHKLLIIYKSNMGLQFSIRTIDDNQLSTIILGN
jgi:hypothetical protein